MDFETATSIIKEKRARLDARNDLLSFIKYIRGDAYLVNWHHWAICDRLTRLRHEEGKKIMIFCGPQRGKSEIVSRMLPAWWLGHFPAAKNIISSYSGDLADSFNSDCQTIMGSEKYKNIFPDLITGHTDPILKMTQSEFHTSEGGYVYSVGATGATTGRSAGNMGVTEPGDSKGFFLLDDPIKDRAQVKSATQMKRIMEWWESVVNTRVHKSSHVILMHTRWAQDDVAGRLIASGALEDGWEILSFPELGPDLRYPNPYDKRTEKNQPLWPEEKGDYDELMKLKARVGSYTWAALFQQNPSIDGGSILKVDDIRLYTRLPFRVEELKSSNIISTWDLTFKSTGTSYCVGIVMGKMGADFYLLDIVRGKMDIIQTKAAIKAMSDRWPNCRNWLIEKAANGEAILTLLQKEVSGLKGIRATVSKDERLHSIAPFFESHNVHIPANHPLTKTIVEELSTFPNGSYDDIVDCFSMAINHYGKLRGINHLRAGVKGLGRRMTI